MAIDLEELIWALNSRDPFGESSHWLHFESGELLFLGGSDAADEVTEDPRDSDRWLCVEPIESSQVFEIMEDFAEQCGEARMARALRQALQQRKPFRRFKDTLAARPAQREAWFTFERHAMEVIARRWCEDHGILPRWIPRPRKPSDCPGAHPWRMRHGSRTMTEPAQGISPQNQLTNPHGCRNARMGRIGMFHF